MTSRDVTRRDVMTTFGHECAQLIFEIMSHNLVIDQVIDISLSILVNIIISALKASIFKSKLLEH